MLEHLDVLALSTNRKNFFTEHLPLAAFGFTQYKSIFSITIVKKRKRKVCFVRNCFR